MNQEQAAQQRELAYQEAALGLRHLPAYELTVDGRAAGVVYELQRRLHAIERAEAEQQSRTRPANVTDEQQIATAMGELRRRGLGRI